MLQVWCSLSQVLRPGCYQSCSSGYQPSWHKCPLPLGCHAAACQAPLPSSGFTSGVTN